MRQREESHTDNRLFSGKGHETIEGQKSNREERMNPVYCQPGRELQDREWLQKSSLHHSRHALGVGERGIATGLTLF